MSDSGRRSPTVATPVAADIGETARTADADRDSTPAGRSAGARAVAVGTRNGPTGDASR